MISVLINFKKHLKEFILNVGIKMSVKMLYRGPSSRLETLIEKIQQTKETGQGN